MLMAKIKSCLSTTQFRRLWMHYAEGKSVTEIAAIEGVSKAGISLALRAARKKSKRCSKRLNKWGVFTCLVKDILSSFPSTSEYTVLQAQPRVNSDVRSAAMTASFGR